MSALGFKSLLLVPIALIILPPALPNPAVGQSGSSNANASAFEVASIRPSGPGTPPSLNTQVTPDGYRAVGQDLSTTIMVAYSPLLYEYWRDHQLTGLPPWSTKDLYDIDARVSAADLEEWQRQGKDNPMLRTMLRSLLAERFHLVIHEEQMESATYALVVGRHGTKMRPATPGEAFPAGTVRLQRGGALRGHRPGEPEPEVPFYGISMDSFAAFLSQSSDIPTVNRTGLSGTYDFTLPHNDPLPGAPDDPDNTWNLQAIGLERRLIKVPGVKLVVDSIARSRPISRYLWRSRQRTSCHPLHQAKMVKSTQPICLPSHVASP